MLDVQRALAFSSYRVTSKSVVIKQSERCHYFVTTTRTPSETKRVFAKPGAVALSSLRERCLFNHECMYSRWGIGSYNRPGLDIEKVPRYTVDVRIRARSI
jgi:hypothetical protein